VSTRGITPSANTNRSVNRNEDQGIQQMQTKRANDRRKSSPRDRSASNKQVVELFIPSDEKISPRQLIIEKLREANQWNDDNDELDEIYIRGKKDQDYKRLKDNMTIHRGDSIVIRRIKKDGKDLNESNDEVTPANFTKTEPSSSEEFYNPSGDSTPRSSYSTPHTPYSSASPIYFTPESSPRPESNTNQMHPFIQQPVIGANMGNNNYENNVNNYSATWPTVNIANPNASVQFFPGQVTNYPPIPQNPQFWTPYNGQVPQYPPQNNYQQ
jgi:hypothetical protein